MSSTTNEDVATTKSAEKRASDETHASVGEKKRKRTTADDMRLLSKEIAKKKLEVLNEKAKAYTDKMLPVILSEIKMEAERGNTSYTFEMREREPVFLEFLRAELCSDKHGFCATEHWYTLYVEWK